MYPTQRYVLGSDRDPPIQIDATDELEIRGRPPLPGERRIVHTTIASPEYFPLAGIPLVDGRTFDRYDRADAPAVAVINRTPARRHFPGEDPVGRRVRIGVMSEPAEREIVGVVGKPPPDRLRSPGSGDPAAYGRRVRTL